MKYMFQKRLIEGEILDHPNRFLMTVRVKGNEFLAHSPTTGKIGSISVDHRPCLLSKPQNLFSDRKTTYTVEAISYNKIEDPVKEWIGINQTASNRYIGWFIANGCMEEMIGRPMRIASEKIFHQSRLDFLADDIYIEVKTPIRIIEKKIPHYIQKYIGGSAYGGKRLIKHMNDLGYLAVNEGKRAIMLTCFQYVRDPDAIYRYDDDAPGLVKYRDADDIEEAFGTAKGLGMENWYAELRIDPEGVELVKYGRLEPRPPREIKEISLIDEDFDFESIEDDSTAIG